jgi:hypothetical protein
MSKKNNKNNNVIQGYEITNDNLTSRAGLNFFVKYLEQVKIYDLFLSYFKGFRKNKKGSSIKNIFKQLILYFADGTYNKISGFNELKKDAGYTSTIECAKSEMCPSHTIKRFFEKFKFKLNHLYEKVLIELFIWRLNKEQPKVIKLFVDTCVLENNYSQKREGVAWTYKKVNGYQPLNIIWNGFPILTVLKEGNRHSLSENTVHEKLQRIIKIIRKRYLTNIPIIVKMDTGFLDEKLFKILDKLKVYFISVARWSESTREAVERTVEHQVLSKYKNSSNSYSYTELGYKCKSWDTFYRAIYLELENDKEQLYLKSFREKTLVISNLKENIKIEYSEDLKKYFFAEEIIKLNHSRGKDELTHRGIKDFGSEQLPFQKFNQNAAFYYTMIISYFLFETFKSDILSDIEEIKNSYATTIRRKIFDVAGKIVKTGRKIIMKIRKTTYDYLNPDDVIEKIKITSVLQI